MNGLEAAYLQTILHSAELQIQRIWHFEPRWLAAKTVMIIYYNTERGKRSHIAAKPHNRIA